jgi:hypothetical protein
LSVVDGSLSPMPDQLLDYRSTPHLAASPSARSSSTAPGVPGFVRGWYRYADRWEASVQYSAPAETRDGTTFPSNHLATFPADQIRQTEVPQ